MNESTQSFESLITSPSFQRYCFGDSGEEKAAWEAWRSAHPDHEALFLEAQSWLLALRGLAEEDEAAAEFARLKPQLKPVPAAKTRKLWRQPRMIAAASIGLALLGFALWQAVWKPAPELVYQTGYGDIHEVVLPDGSQVSLNANTKLRCADDWSNTSHREVWLTGEAFFVVAHDEDKPFVVHTAKGDIQVLGTRFNVLQRSEFFRVALVEGSIELSPQDRPAFLMKPGQEMRLSQEGIQVAEVDTDPITAWKDHQMIFRNARIADIIEKLKWDFNLDIEVIRTEILERRVNAFIQENDPELLLAALAEIYDLEIETKGAGVYQIK